MHYFYFDAAGDPGFQLGKTLKAGGSKPFYVLCVISTEDKYATQNVIIELRGILNLKLGYEFKYHTLDVKKRQPFFAELVKHNFTAYVAVLDKQHSSQARSFSLFGGNLLTNTLVIPLISLAIADLSPPLTKFHLTIDQAKHDKIIPEMRVALSKELRQQNLTCKSKISPGDSKKEDCLQLADMIAGMVMDSYETNNKELYSIIQKKVVLNEI
ncbi:MAG: DUF3800 domain-containing protein [Chloroflexi bacterium]|nr:DUF3800 domain-containing protein [Chloroflexota bacterium]